MKFKQTAKEPGLDLYDFDALLTEDERAWRKTARAFADAEIIPHIGPYWERGEFPEHIFKKMATLGVCGGSLQGYGCPGLSNVAVGVIAMELARGDGSLNTAFGVTSGLAMCSIYFCGSEEQKQKWLPQMATMEKTGAFGLTEPFVGSDASHITTTARKVSDGYVLDGAKRWIGNADRADVVVIWAQDDQTGQVSGFLVEKGSPGYAASPISGKLALRTLVNCDIELKNCFVPMANKLVNCNSFRDVAKVLRATRFGVAWEAIGHAVAAYELALAYSKKRMQFGRPIASFQLIQDKLVRMLAEVESMKLMGWRLSKLADEGKLSEGQASLAKVHCCRRAREVVALGRELMGGNGILLEHHMARHFADMEAVYTYEGTNEINTLVVGREITGLQAFA
jgi:glutaryl-CoA dehydrogenase